MSSTKSKSRETKQELQLSDTAQRRKNALLRVESAVCRDRTKTHGDAEDNFSDIAEVWTIHLRRRRLIPKGANLVALDVAHMMASMKLCRASGFMEYLDHWDDLSGYGACGSGIVDRIVSGK